MTLALNDGTAAARAYRLVEALARRDGSNGFYTMALIAALCRGTEEAWALVEYPGAAAYLAPDVAPVEWLPLLAAATGARLLPAMTEADRRAEINSPFDRRRGTNDAIKDVSRRYLNGANPYVALFERTDPAAPGDAPDDLTIVTRTDETPTDTSALQQAWERVVPVDVEVHHVLFEGVLIEEAPIGTKIDDVAAGVKIDTVTMGDL